MINTPVEVSVCACDAACNCFEHADTCYYDDVVARYMPTLNATAVRSGGGVCIDCQHNTTGTVTRFRDVNDVIVFFLTCTRRISRIVICGASDQNKSCL